MSDTTETNNAVSPKKNVVSQRRLSSSTSHSITSRIPNNSWDSHMHVTSPSYPLATHAAYKPSLHSLEHAMTFEKTIGVPNIVLVQPSIYGNDNSCLLDALRELGPHHGRGVVGVDPTNTDEATLREWHALGVRGVRLNLKSNNTEFDETSLRETLQQYAAVARPFDWVLQVYIGMESIPLLENVVPGLGVKFCIDHFGGPTLPSSAGTSRSLDPYSLTGFGSLARLLQGGRTWVKFSAAYRHDPDPEMRGIESVAKELLRVAGNRLVFASDWPHTRFDGLDVKPFVQKCLEWTEESGTADRVFRQNAEALWDADVTT